MCLAQTLSPRRPARLLTPLGPNPTKSGSRHTFPPLRATSRGSTVVPWWSEGALLATHGSHGFSVTRCAARAGWLSLHSTCSRCANPVSATTAFLPTKHRPVRQTWRVAFVTFPSFIYILTQIKRCNNSHGAAQGHCDTAALPHYPRLQGASSRSSAQKLGFL